jgi:hypothetical protein
VPFRVVVDIHPRHGKPQGTERFGVGSPSGPQIEDRNAGGGISLDGGPPFGLDRFSPEGKGGTCLAPNLVRLVVLHNNR